ncbi:MAG: TetR/AcrR family transcriptional regulator [Tetrasphaera sp.]
MAKRDGASGGRVKQKARTRNALVEALRELLARGQDPSVADVAAAAGISRTTAYRYFPDRHSLLGSALPETGQVSLLDDAEQLRVTDPVTRFELALTRHFAFMRRWEPQLRAALRASLEGNDQPMLRGGRAVRWYADALAPLSQSRPELDVDALAVRLRAVAGIEPHVWLTGVAGLSRSASYDVMRANAMAVLADALGPASLDVRGSSVDCDAAELTRG